MTKALPNLAVLGATGVVGREILNILDENDVKYNSIKFLASIIKIVQKFLRLDLYRFLQLQDVLEVQALTLFYLL